VGNHGGGPARIEGDMMTDKDLMERARQLASEGHCRYCDRRDDPRLKCAGDIEDCTEEIAAALLAVRKETLEEAKIDKYESIQIRFDGPPGLKGGRFIEIELTCGKSISLGEWKQDGNDWLLVIPQAIRKEE